MTSSDPKPETRLDITGSDPPSIPVFTCIVYVSRQGDVVTARVANLAGIEATGASERDVLAKVCREFKARIAKFAEAGDELSLIEAPAPAENEQVRSIPVHL